ncbi:MAG: phosphatidate cytidylyltransferase [Porphyromonas sp.]|uniref:phosphatidate cytidylyltransferase n=1 Tax=Porphyromonas sp. TaxID=1924944 RepID=UPI002A74DCA3|nr:phosphatidate cytidylyltransferase [Porphyromonas sp.]MDY3111230.1 phosphatidate cytidylyltransferase [Porphyromonas sp.]
MSTFTTRLISGTIYVALIVLTLVLSMVWGLWILLSVFAVAGIIEFNRLTDVNRPYIFRIVLDCAAAVWLLYATAQYGMAISHGTGIFLPYLLYLLYVVCRSTFLPHQAMLPSLGNSLIGQLYIAVPLALAIRLTLDPTPSSSMTQFNGLLLLAIFIFIWANDTGAYLVGSRWGRTPLAPSISPKKSVEGSIGGLLLVLLSAVVLRLLLFPELSWLSILLIAAVVAIFGTIGDLFESSLKRQAGVKDSGKLIPGHGGILDRIDSLLLAVPAVYLLLAVLDLY